MHGRRDALALPDLLVPFHSFLVQQTADRSVAHTCRPLLALKAMMPSPPYAEGCSSNKLSRSRRRPHAGFPASKATHSVTTACRVPDRTPSLWRLARPRGSSIDVRVQDARHAR
jgi:hypothetical protein